MDKGNSMQSDSSNQNGKNRNQRDILPLIETNNIMQPNNSYFPIQYPNMMPVNENFSNQSQTPYNIAQQFPNWSTHNTFQQPNQASYIYSNQLDDGAYGSGVENNIRNGDLNCMPISYNHNPAVFESNTKTTTDIVMNIEQSSMASYDNKPILDEPNDELMKELDFRSCSLDRYLTDGNKF